MGVATASFTARRERYRQEFEFTADGVFSVTVLPLGVPRAGVVICPSLYEDSMRNSRREVLLARRLAALGVAVGRFYYRGTGYSMGVNNDLAWPGILEDANDAWARLRARVGDDVPFGLMSARFGSLVAAALASRQPKCPIALWEPVTRGHAYVRDLARMERVALLTGAHREPQPVAPPIPPSLASEIGGLSLDELAGGGLGPVLVVRLGRAASAGAQSDDEEVAGLSSSVEHREYPEEGTWWAGTRAETRDSLDPWPLIDDTASWLYRSLEASSR